MSEPEKKVVGGIFSGMQGASGGAWSFASGPNAVCTTQISADGHTTGQTIQSVPGSEAAMEKIWRDSTMATHTLPPEATERPSFGDVQAQSGVLPSGIPAGLSGLPTLGLGFGLPGLGGAIGHGGSAAPGPPRMLEGTQDRTTRY